MSPQFLKAFSLLLSIRSHKFHRCCNAISVLVSMLFMWKHNDCWEPCHKSHVDYDGQRYFLDQMTAIRAFAAERYDPVFVNVNLQQFSKLPQQDVFHKSKVKCHHSLQNSYCLNPRCNPSYTKSNDNIPTDFHGCRFSLSEATGVSKHCFQLHGKARVTSYICFSFCSN